MPDGPRTNGPAFSKLYEDKGHVVTRREMLKLSTLSGAALIVECLAAEAAAYDPEYSIPSSGPNGLRCHGMRRNLPVGSAVVVQQIQNNPRLSELLQSQAGILVADWQMKWEALRPSPTTFFFKDADWLVSYAESHNQLLRGHNLCWHVALPKWFGSYVNSSNAREVLAEHITTVASRYAGKIHSWDVVNEAIDIDGGRHDSLRVSPWLTLIGTDYIDFAFRTARKADPHALLTYNDFNIEAQNQARKRNAVLSLVTGMRARGVPIDAVGIQSHLTVTNRDFGSGIVAFIRDLAKMDVQVFITELDVNDASLQGDVRQRDAQVAQIYRKYLDLVLPEPNVTALLTWEERDTDSYLQSKRCRDGSAPRPLPFDADYAAKPAFLAMRNAIDRCSPKSPTAAGRLGRGVTECD
jgi:endo-1,4-beta-xylanase